MGVLPTLATTSVGSFLRMDGMLVFLFGRDPHRVGFESEIVKSGQELNDIVSFPSLQEARVSDHRLFLMLYAYAFDPFQLTSLPFGFQEVHPLADRPIAHTTTKVIQCSLKVEMRNTTQLHPSSNKAFITQSAVHSDHIQLVQVCNWQNNCVSVVGEGRPLLVGRRLGQQLLGTGRFLYVHPGSAG